MADGWSISSTNKSTLIDLGYTAWNKSDWVHIGAEKNIQTMLEASRNQRCQAKRLECTWTECGGNGMERTVADQRVQHGVFILCSPWLGLAPESLTVLKNVITPAITVPTLPIRTPIYAYHWFLRWTLKYFPRFLAAELKLLWSIQGGAPPVINWLIILNKTMDITTIRPTKIRVIGW